MSQRSAPPNDRVGSAAGVLDATLIDVEHAAPAGHNCRACGTPLDADDRFCPACGTVHEAAAAPTAATATAQHLRCDACGAEILLHEERRSYICPFCESTYVLQVPASENRPQPEFVIGFAITSEQAEARFRAWISERSFFRPADLAFVQLEDRLRGVYLPFWHFAVTAESVWQATIGQHWYRTETVTSRGPDGKMRTTTRQVQETEWWPLQGRHHHYYSGYLVSAAKGLSQAEADSIRPFQLPALKRYDPSYLAGWQAEEASVSRDEALPVCTAEFEQQERRNIASFLPGDTHRALEVRTQFSNVTSDLCLLPLYLMNYRYRGVAYRFLINGQTGKIVGRRPISSTRVAIAIALGIGAVLLIGSLFIAAAALLGGAN